MRKLLVFHHFGGIGGAGLSLLHILKSIDVSKNKVTVVCPEVPSEMIEEIRLLNIEVIATKETPKIFAHYNGGIKYFLSLRTPLNLYDIIKDYKNVKKIIEDSSPDLIMLNSMTLFWIGIITKSKGINAICFDRESFQKGLFGFRSWIIKNGLSKYFQKVVFISRFDMNEANKISSQKIIIHDKVDESVYRAVKKEDAQNLLGLDPAYKYILYLGGYSKLKGAHIVMECMRYFKNDKIKLLFVRSIETPKGARKQTLFSSLKNTIKGNSYLQNKNLIEKYNLQDKVVFLDTIPNPEIYYKASDVIVFPSTKAHQARPIYEAGFAKIPIVITDFPETREFAVNGQTALTFTNKNLKSLYEKIEQSLTNNDLRKKLIENNYKQSDENHNLKSLSYEIEELLRDI